MKKSLLFKSLLFVSLLLGAAACNNKPKPTSSEEPSSVAPSSEEPSSQDASSADPQKGDANWVDYVNNGSVKLGLDYKGKDFFKDGVGQFTLKTPIDGDTAHFTPVGDGVTQETLKARFYGIDTPESTGQVQEYGKPASNFTKDVLKEADKNGTIVVSSAQDTYGAPQPDSTGERFVSLVWVNMTKKNANFDELVLVNLWIVQEGLSWVKNVKSMPQYQETFYSAQEQARTYKLNLFSGKPDETFNYGDYKDISLLEIKKEVGECLADESHQNLYNNEKLRIQGTVAGYSNHILYLEDFFYYDEEDASKGGEYCGINIFVGMSDIPSKYTTLNTYIQVCGLAQQTENYGFQVTSVVSFPAATGLTENDSKVIFKPDENAETEHNLHVFQYTNAQLSAISSAKDPYNLEPLNCRVEITETLEVEKVYISESSSKEITLNFKNSKYSVYVPFNYKGDPSRPNYRWVLESDFLGEKFNVSGVYVHHRTQSGKNTFQLVPSGTADLVWVPES